MNQLTLKVSGGQLSGDNCTFYKVQEKFKKLGVIRTNLVTNRHLQNQNGTLNTGQLQIP